MNKLRVGIDMDGVICDLLSVWLKKYNDDFHDDLQIHEITKWNWHSLTNDPEGKRLYTYLDDQDLFFNLPVIENSQKVLKKYNNYFDFWVVSAAYNPMNIYPKVKWLQKHFSFLDEEKFMFVRNKSGFNGDMLIDDKPGNLEMFEGEKLLFNAPHNQTETRFNRMKNWDEIDTYLLKQLTGKLLIYA